MHNYQVVSLKWVLQIYMHFLAFILCTLCDNDRGGEVEEAVLRHIICTAGIRRLGSKMHCVQKKRRPPAQMPAAAAKRFLHGIHQIQQSVVLLLCKTIPFVQQFALKRSQYNTRLSV